MTKTNDMATAEMPAADTKRKSVIWFGLQSIALILSAYMIYATIFGPYRTTLVHLGIFLAGSFVLYFFREEAGNALPPLHRRIVNWICALGTLICVAHLIINLDRIINSWGASFLTTTDLAVGILLCGIVLEAARRESFAFFLLSIIGIAYILFGNHLPGVFNHAGMGLPQFLYLSAYTNEGIFGFGLEVAASYLFMFLLLSAAMTSTGTGAFIMDLCNACFGRMTGGPAKSAVMASAAMGTMVGSSIGNVATTGTFTIPLMKRSGIPAHKAGAIETVASEGSQFLPPIMGAGAFIMASITGIPYSTIVLAALIPAVLYYLAIFSVVHFEAVRLRIGGMADAQIPNMRSVLRAGWHLSLPPILLFYLLMGRGLSPSYAGLIALAAAIVVSCLRATTRPSLTGLVMIFTKGAISASQIVALIVAIGFIQQALVTTGLAPRLSDIILSATDGSVPFTLILGVLIATLLGMGMPTPIAYLLLALFVAPSLEAVGISTLAAHLFLFYFAIKSGSTPPVAVVAMVAAAIAEANWWRTSVWAFIYSLPSFIVAFMFVYFPALLMQGTWSDIVQASVTASVGTVLFTGALQGWFWVRLPIVSRGLIAIGAVGMVANSLVVTCGGLALIGFGLLFAYFVRPRAEGGGAAGAS